MPLLRKVALATGFAYIVGEEREGHGERIVSKLIDSEDGIIKR
jgi:hypothetical protein